MSSVTQGAHLIDILNYLKVDYCTFGNHELDYGYESLKNRLKGVDDDVYDEVMGLIDYPQTTSTWIMTNMTEADGKTPLGGEFVQKTVLVDWDCSKKVADGTIREAIIKVGLLAVSEDWLKNCSQIKRGELLYEDFIESARNAARDLRARGAEVVLAVTHSRLANDYKLMEAVPEIDLLLGGHDHFYHEDLPKRIVKSGEEWRWTSYIRIDLHDGEDKPRITLERKEITREHPVDEQVDHFIAKYRALEKKKFNCVLFKTAVDLDPTEDAVRFKESLFANWICDMLCEDYSLQEGFQTADIAMLMGFDFAGKAVIPAGNFTLGHIMATFPKVINIVVLKLTGEEIVKTLNLGVCDLPGECGSIHHVSSRVSYTTKLPSPLEGVEGGLCDKPLVTEVLFDGQPIDPARVFTVAMNASHAEGSYGYTWLKEAERVVEEEYASTLQDLIRMYCKRNRKNPKAYPANVEGGRIKIVS